MMTSTDSYRLLRSNKELGPFSLEQLLDLGLKPYDLIWVDGKSAAWRYPGEIEALKPFAPLVEEQPFDRFFKKSDQVIQPPSAPTNSTAPTLNKTSSRIFVQPYPAKSPSSPISQVPPPPTSQVPPPPTSQPFPLNANDRFSQATDGKRAFHSFSSLEPVQLKGNVPHPISVPLSAEYGSNQQHTPSRRVTVSNDLLRWSILTTCAVGFLWFTLQIFKHQREDFPSPTLPVHHSAQLNQVTPSAPSPTPPPGDDFMPKKSSFSNETTTNSSELPNKENLVVNQRPFAENSEKTFRQKEKSTSTQTIVDKMVKDTPPLNRKEKVDATGYSSAVNAGQRVPVYREKPILTNQNDSASNRMNPLSSAEENTTDDYQKINAPTDPIVPVDVLPISFQKGGLGGFYNIQSGIKNNSKLPLKKVFLVQEIYGPQQKNLERRELVLENVPPGETQRVSFPNSSRGVRMKIYIAKIDMGE